MEEIYLHGVIRVRAVKILTVFHSSAGAGQLDFLMGRCSQRKKLHLAGGWIPLGFGEINLDKSGPLMANMGETSQYTEWWSSFFGIKHRGAWHHVFAECLWGKAASLMAMCICFRPYFTVEPGVLVFALVLLHSNYLKA